MCPGRGILFPVPVSNMHEAQMKSSFRFGPLQMSFERLTMVDDDFWRTVQDKDLVTSQSRRTGVLNLSLLFGTAVIALTLILTPMLASKTDNRVLANAPFDYDNIQTGSIPSGNATKRYTVRRSVLQEMPGAVCIIDSDGTKSGC